MVRFSLFVMHKQLKCIRSLQYWENRKITQIKYKWLTLRGCCNSVLKMEWVDKLVLNADVVKHSNQNLHPVSIYNITFIFFILIPSPLPIADAAVFTFNKLGNDSTNCCFPSAHWLGNVVCTSGIIHGNGVSRSIQCSLDCGGTRGTGQVSVLPARTGRRSVWHTKTKKSLKSSDILFIAWMPWLCRGMDVFISCWKELLNSWLSKHISLTREALTQTSKWCMYREKRKKGLHT